MEYRNTPINNFPHSANQMLFNRQIRTRVPVHPVVLVAQVCQDVSLLLEKRQSKYNEFYDRGSKRLPPLKEGDSIRFKKMGEKHLAPDVGKGEHETPRSYVITDGAGKEYRRNKRQIHLTHEPPTTIGEYLSDEPESVTDQFDVNLLNVSTEYRADFRTNNHR